MAQKISRKSLKRDEFVEAAFDLEAWFENHWKPVAWAVAGAIGLGIVIGGVYWWNGRRHREIERQLSEALSRIEAPAAGATSTATDARSRYAGVLPDLEEISRRGSGSSAGRVAEFYRAAALLRLDRASEAIPILEPITVDGTDLLADLARAKLAWAYEATGQPDKAVQAWKDLSTRTEAYFPPDMALLSAAGVLERSGRGEESKAIFEEILAKYPNAAATEEARTKLGRTASPPPGAIPLSR